MEIFKLGIFTEKGKNVADESIGKHECIKGSDGVDDPDVQIRYQHQQDRTDEQDSCADLTGNQSIPGGT